MLGTVVTKVCSQITGPTPQVLGSSCDYCDSCTEIHKPFMRVLSFARFMGCQISCLLVPDPIPDTFFFGATDALRAMVFEN